MNDAYMSRAIRLAGRGRPFPNPFVGAVIVKDGRIVSEGYHKRAGMPHAEAEALRGVDAWGATLYVNLEPCSHHGRTPPCTDIIIDSGISHVVYAMDDPTKKVCGRRVLEDAGIRVTSGILEQKAKRLNEAFIKHCETGLPFIILKVAMSLDANSATSSGKSKWITCDAARRHARRQRQLSDAIIAGVETIIADDPRLTSRSGGGPEPLKVVLDSRLRIPKNAKVFEGGNLLIATSCAAKKNVIDELKNRCEVVVCGEKTVDISRLLKELGKRGVICALVEGGPGVISSFLRQGHYDKILAYIAPMVMGGANKPSFGASMITNLCESHMLSFEKIKRVGDDLLITARPKR